MKHLKIYEENNIIPIEYINFIKWLTVRTDLKINKRKYAYDEVKERWLDLKDYETYYDLNDLYLIYKTEKYNL